MVLCSGWIGVFNLEDSIFAGYLIDNLLSFKEFNINCDSVLASLELNKNKYKPLSNKGLFTLLILLALVIQVLPGVVERGGIGLIRVILMITTSAIAMIVFIKSFIDNIK